MGLLNEDDFLAMEGQGANGAPMAPPAPMPAGPPLNESTFLAAEGPQANGPQQRPGLLHRLGSTTPDGITLADRLTALGSILKGDGGGAQSYLQNQRANADVLKQRAQKTDVAKRAHAALMAAYATGKFDPQTYLSMLPDEADPSDGLKVRNELRDKVERMSGPGGSIYEGSPYEPGMRQVIAGAKPLINPDGTINEDVLAAQAKAKEALAAAERRGKPLAPHVGRAAPKRGSYGNDEVSY